MNPKICADPRETHGTHSTALLSGAMSGERVQQQALGAGPQLWGTHSYMAPSMGRFHFWNLWREKIGTGNGDSGNQET